jgi:predicted RNA methylase
VVVASLIWSPGGPWLPTSRKNARKMLAMAKVKPGDVVYDLGSGDGRILFIAAKEFGAKAVGIEIDPFRYAYSKLMVRLHGLQDQVEVRFGNFFKHDLSQADVLTAYLLQRTNNRLIMKLIKELRPGTRVVANTFIFPGWLVVDKDPKQQLYLYEVQEKNPEPS